MWKGVDGLKSSMEKLSDKSTASELSKEDAEVYPGFGMSWESNVLVSIPRVSVSGRAFMNSPIVRRDSFKLSTRSAFRVCSLFSGEAPEGSNSKVRAMKSGCSSNKNTCQEVSYPSQILLETPCGKGSFFNQHGGLTGSTMNPSSLFNTLQRASSEMVYSSASRIEGFNETQDPAEFLGKRSQMKLEFLEMSTVKRSRLLSGINQGLPGMMGGMAEEVLDGICINKH